MACNDNRTIITVNNVAAIQRLIHPYIRRTPLLQSDFGGLALGGQKAVLKCENLQITSSFKLRGALAALLGYQKSRPDIWRRIERDGVVTSSSGNFAQGLAYATALLGLSCTVIVPAAAASYKLEQIARFNPAARLVQVPYPKWQQTMVRGSSPETPGYFLSSESDPFVSLGNATIAMEILEDLPDLDALLVPYGGGNLAYSIASITRCIRPEVSVYAVEVETGAPLTASMRAGKPVEVEYRPSFVDGIGASFVIPAQFDRVSGMLSGVVTVTPEEIAEALTFLAHGEKMIAEGAGAATLAAARHKATAYGWQNPCCIISGGVICPDMFLQTLGVARPSRSPVLDAESGSTNASHAIAAKKPAE